MQSDEEIEWLSVLSCSQNTFSSVVAPPAAAPTDAANQQAMLAQLAQKTNMNERFTLMCLSEAGWNLDTAYTNFLEAQRNGKIPEEAFQK